MSLSWNETFWNCFNVQSRVSLCIWSLCPCQLIYVTSSLWSWYLQLIYLWIMKTVELERAVTGRRHSLQLRNHQLSPIYMWHPAYDPGIYSLSICGSWRQQNWRGQSLAWYSVSLHPSVFEYWSLIPLEDNVTDTFFSSERNTIYGNTMMTAFMLGGKFCGSHLIMIWMRANPSFHLIRVTTEKYFFKFSSLI